MAIPVSTGPEDYLQEGMTDPRVGELQQALRQAGYDIAVDNIYGPETASAVEDLQRKSGIKVDRIYGPETYGALQKALAPKEPPTMAETTGTPAGTPPGTSRGKPTGTTAPDGFPEYKPPEFPEY